MDAQSLDELRTRHAFETWRESNALGENLFISGLFLNGNELTGWRSYRIQAVELEGWPRSIQSVWLRETGETDVLLSLDIFECESRAAAKEFLLRMLGEFQSPLITRQEGLDIGDVAFSGPGETNLLFARANIVVIARNAGQTVVPVRDAAREFDGMLTTRPDAAAEQRAVSIDRFELAGDLSPGTPTPLVIEVSDPLSRQIWYKLFSSTGEVLSQAGGLAYRPAAAGAQEITLYAVAAGGVASRTLRVSAREQREPRS